jgi:hypothetical protein
MRTPSLCADSKTLDEPFIKVGTHTQCATVIPAIVALNSYRFFPSEGLSLCVSIQTCVLQ